MVSGMLIIVINTRNYYPIIQHVCIYSTSYNGVGGHL